MRAGRPERQLDKGFCQANRKAINQADEFADIIQRHRGVRVHKAIMADLHKTFGQDMLEKAADELHDIDGGGPPSVGTGFFVFKKDLVIFDIDDAAV